MKKLSALLLALVFVFAAVSCASPDSGITVVKDQKEKITKLIKGDEKLTKKLDYAQSGNWLALEEDPVKSVDVIFFMPTAYRAEEGGNELSSADDASLREKAPEFLKTQAAVFAEDCNVFAPFYRQYDLSFLASLDRADRELAYEYAASIDAEAAIDRYFSTLNNGRPFILAGHGQGSEMVRMILAHYMKDHPDVYRRMVAAYAIGCAVTKPFLNEYPHLKFARGETDTGVIVSFNTEGQGNYSFKNDFVIDRLQTLVINPLSWNSDKVSVSKSKNLGMLDANGEPSTETTGAHVNPDRGTVVCDDEQQIAQYVYEGEYEDLFGPQSLHFYDYSIFFVNLRENVGRRVAAFFAARS